MKGKPEPIMSAFGDKTEGEGTIVQGQQFTTHTYLLDGIPIKGGEHLEILSLNGTFIPAVVFQQTITQGVVVGIPITTVYGVDMIRMVPLPGGTLARRVE